MASETGNGRSVSNGAPSSVGSTTLGKRKKVRSRRTDFLNNWLEKAALQAMNSVESDSGMNCVPPVPALAPLPAMPPSYSPYFGPPQLYHQRLFTAASDPSVCRYSAPYQYPSEPVSFPVCTSPYYPFAHAFNSNEFIAQPPLNPRVKNLRRFNYHKKTRSSKKSPTENGKTSPSDNAETRSGVMSVNGDFASLPPVVNHTKENNLSVNGNEDIAKAEKRRFSDPGFAQNEIYENPQEESVDESDSEASSVLYGDRANNRLIVCLVDHINTLKENNRRLHKELHDTRTELESLKQQLSVWRGDSSSINGVNGNNNANSPNGGGGATGATGSTVMYAPGMLADLVREIRDASKAREEAIFNKIRSLIDEKNYKSDSNPSWDKYSQDWHNFEQLQNQHQTTFVDKARTNDRIGKLEEELYNLRINSSRDSLSPCSSAGFAMTGVGNLPSASEQDRIRIQMELNKERSARAAADSRVHKLELLVTQLRSKRGGSGSYLTVPSPHSSHTPVLNGLSANSTPVIALSPDPRQMVLGPITDL